MAAGAFHVGESSTLGLFQASAPSPPAKCLRSGVGMDGHTQVSLRVRVQLRFQGPALHRASHDQHGVLVLL